MSVNTLFVPSLWLVKNLNLDKCIDHPCTFDSVVLGAFGRYAGGVSTYNKWL